MIMSINLQKDFMPILLRLSVGKVSLSVKFRVDYLSINFNKIDSNRFNAALVERWLFSKVSSTIQIIRYCGECIS